MSEKENKPSKRTWRRRVGIVLLSIITPLIVIEAILQITHAALASRPARWGITDPEAPVILCFGDSHTYGFGVSPEKAYPAQLEQKLRNRGYSVNVVNLGAPGMNTSEIRRRAPQWMTQYKPVAVIMLAGINNGWNVKDADWSDTSDGLEVPLKKRTIVWLQTNIRIVRGVSLLVHRMNPKRPEEIVRDRQGRIVEHEWEEAWDTKDGTISTTRGWRDFQVVIHQAKGSGVIPHLMTYVGPNEEFFVLVNMMLKELADHTETTLADNNEALRSLFVKADGTPDEQAINAIFMEDWHLTAEGYDKITDNILDALNRSGTLKRLPHAKMASDQP